MTMLNFFLSSVHDALLSNRTKPSSSNGVHVSVLNIVLPICINAYFLIIPLIVLNFALKHIKINLSFTSAGIEYYYSNKTDVIPWNDISEMFFHVGASSSTRKRRIVYRLTLKRKSEPQELTLPYYLDIKDLLDISLNNKISNILNSYRIKTNLYEFLEQQSNFVKHEAYIAIIIIAFFSLIISIIFFNILIELLNTYEILSIPYFIVLFIFSGFLGIIYHGLMDAIFVLLKLKKFNYVKKLSQ